MVYFPGSSFKYPGGSLWTECREHPDPDSDEYSGSNRDSVPFTDRDTGKSGRWNLFGQRDF
jgi:hypothetical protein